MRNLVLVCSLLLVFGCGDDSDPSQMNVGGVAGSGGAAGQGGGEGAGSRLSTSGPATVRRRVLTELLRKPCKTHPAPRDAPHLGNTIKTIKINKIQEAAISRRTLRTFFCNHSPSQEHRFG